MNDITLSRACEVVEIPSGSRASAARWGPWCESANHSATVIPLRSAEGQMYRVEDKDADALGLADKQGSSAAKQGRFSEEAVWDELRTVFDPEIPVNIVDLGLIYSCVITPLPEDRQPDRNQDDLNGAGMRNGRRASGGGGAQAFAIAGGEGSERRGGLRSALGAKPHVRGRQAAAWPGLGFQPEPYAADLEAGKVSYLRNK